MTFVVGLGLGILAFLFRSWLLRTFLPRKHPLAADAAGTLATAVSTPTTLTTTSGITQRPATSVPAYVILVREAERAPADGLSEPGRQRATALAKWIHDVIPKRWTRGIPVRALFCPSPDASGVHQAAFQTLLPCSWQFNIPLFTTPVAATSTTSTAVQQLVPLMQGVAAAHEQAVVVCCPYQCMQTLLLALQRVWGISFVPSDLWKMWNATSVNVLGGGLHAAFPYWPADNYGRVYVCDVAAKTCVPDCANLVTSDAFQCQDSNLVNHSLTFQDCSAGGAAT